MGREMSSSFIAECYEALTLKGLPPEFAKSQIKILRDELKITSLQDFRSKSDVELIKAGVTDWTIEALAQHHFELENCGKHIVRITDQHKEDGKRD